MNSVVDMSSECAAQSAIQYFENMRNFLVAVGSMQLLTFEASDLEKVRFSPFFHTVFPRYIVLSKGFELLGWFIKQSCRLHFVPKGIL